MEIGPVRWGCGERIDGTPFDEVVSADRSGGAMVVLGATVPPGVVVDAHTHQTEDQVAIVIEGTLGVRCGDVEALLGAGDVFFLPRGVPHSLWNPTDRPTRVLDAYTPPGIEALFAAGGQVASSSSST